MNHELLYLIGIILICLLGLGILWVIEGRHIQHIMDEERLYKRIHEKPMYTYKSKNADTSYRVRDSTRNEHGQ